ncbi:hypothetical protein [Levilactobacillus bambusae]|uniref:GNAT family N-acetyltransferase n=1 Tax=Levilactobacillus bambusae TaxID=2024736 RepID=A0A2V1MZV9_9LACO|nr:hypothetical protein [Levilactobacillus bambusae]PWG00028.1 hypothetical protein DCM90_03570 [Levilactobacillus bambusae]
MLRDATITDADHVFALVLHELERRNWRILRRVSKEQLSQVLFVGYHAPDFRYGLNQVRVYENQGVAAGVAFGYPAANEANLDQQWDDLFAKFQIQLTKPFPPVVRAYSDEWYLDLLEVSPRYRHKAYRGQTFAEYLMQDAIHRTRLSGYRYVGLDARPGSPLADLAAEFGFVVTQTNRFDRQSWVHLRLRLV